MFCVEKKKNEFLCFGVLSLVKYKEVKEEKGGKKISFSDRKKKGKENVWKGGER